MECSKLGYEKQDQSKKAQKPSSLETAEKAKEKEKE
jgi:hypothetical protein